MATRLHHGVTGEQLKQRAIDYAEKRDALLEQEKALKGKEKELTAKIEAAKEQQGLGRNMQQQGQAKVNQANAGLQALKEKEQQRNQAVEGVRTKMVTVMDKASQGLTKFNDGSSEVKALIKTIAGFKEEIADTNKPYPQSRQPAFSKTLVEADALIKKLKAQQVTT